MHRRESNSPKWWILKGEALPQNAKKNQVYSVLENLPLDEIISRTEKEPSETALKHFLNFGYSDSIP